MFELSKLGRFQLINAIWRIFPFQRHLAAEWKETRIEWPTRPRINNSGASFRVIVGPYITSRRSVSCWRHLVARRIFFLLRLGHANFSFKAAEMLLKIWALVEQS